jgi:TonB family protein
MLASNKLRIHSRLSVAALALFVAAAAPFTPFNWSNPAMADELPLTLQVLNYQAFSGPDLQSYMMRTKEQIREHWHPKSNKPHTAKVFFQIFADGSLLQHEIQQSSGNKEYDDEAKAVVVSCVPYPPPPPGSVRIINVVATFGANPGSGGVGAGGIAYAGAGASAYAGTPNVAKSATLDGGSTGSGSYSGSDSGGSNVSGSPHENASEGSHAPLQGSASETGMMQSSASSEAPPRVLQGEVGAAGYAAPPMMQGQAMAMAPPAPPMFQSQMAMQAPLQGGAQRPLLQADASHGAMTIGVLGCEFGLMNGQIRQILPGSDLLRYGIQPGDVIEAADGQPLRGRALQAYTRGTPGTYVQLTILHQGQIATFPIQRKDARTFSNYNGYFKKWAAQEKFW